LVWQGRLKHGFFSFLRTIFSIREKEKPHPYPISSIHHHSPYFLLQKDKNFTPAPACSAARRRGGK